MVRNNAGKLMDGRDEHPEKAEVPIPVSEAPKVSEVIPEQLANAEVSTVFILLGIVRLVMPEQPLKADSPILIMPYTHKKYRTE